MLDQNFREPTAFVHYVSTQNCEAVVPKPQHKSLKTAGLFLTSAKVLLIRLVMNFLSLISLSLAARVFRCYEFSPWLHLRQQECVYVMLASNKFLGLESRGPKQQFCRAYCNDTNLYHRGMEVFQRQNQNVNENVKQAKHSPLIPTFLRTRSPSEMSSSLLFWITDVFLFAKTIYTTHRNFALMLIFKLLSLSKQCQKESLSKQLQTTWVE